MKELKKSDERKYGVLLNYVQIGLHVVFSLLYTPLMIRLLGKNEYGLYGTVMSFIGLLDLLTMGFGNSYIKFYSKYKIAGEHDRIKRFNALYTSVFLVISSIALILG
ncbi:MAG: oligosaccharide flippase family protein, partial [Eubacterium sp.]|nr:oligosaccharide flippase family protein [Eubacterium sp.]